LAAACVAAPGVLVQNGLVGTAPFAQTVYAAAPAVATVQVPVTKTVHYETKPVVTGYSTSIIKPAIAQTLAAAPVLQQVVAQPAVVQQVAQPVAVAPVAGTRQIPSIPNFPSFPPPPGNGSSDNPGGLPGFPPLPDFPQLPGGGGNGTADAPTPPPAPMIPDIPQFPGIPEIPTPPPANNPSTTQAPPTQGSRSFFFNNFNTPFHFAPVETSDAVVVDARAAGPVVQSAPVVQQLVAQPAPVAVAAPVVAVRAAQAADFEPLVTKEKVGRNTKADSFDLVQIIFIYLRLYSNRFLLQFELTPRSLHN